MSRGRALSTLAAVAVAVALACAVSGCAERERSAAGSTPPRHLLLITLDTVRADHLGLYGYERPTSPNLDRFAERATVFEDVTCSMPTTLPSHLTLFTGLPPSRHGVRRNGEIPPADLQSIFSAFKASGYRTAAVVSAGVLARRFLEPLAFDEVHDDQLDPEVHQVSAEVVNQLAFSWLDQHAGGNRPFALWLHYFDAHEPYAPPPSFAGRFTGDYDGPLGDALSIPFLVSLNRPEVRAELDADDLQHVVDLYDAEISYLDAELGRLFDRLERSGLLRDTAVIIVGDHGQAHGENAFFGHGEQLLEPVIQIPLIVRLPGQKKPRRIGTGVESLDLAPTLSELFDLAWQPRGPGRSLMPALRGAALEPAGPRLVERRSYPDEPQRSGLAILSGQRKWTWYREADGTSLLHLGRRDGEGGLDGENFHDPASADARRLLDVLAAREQPGEEPAAAEDSMSEETLQMLRSLGYL